MAIQVDPEHIQMLYAAARNHDRTALAKLLSIVEGPQAGDVVSAIFPHTGQAHVVGFTGAPGSGKSTLVDASIGQLRKDDIEVAVLAVDPSSPFSGGAILGDRVRMQSHSLDEGVFIRSMASRGALGGLAVAAPNAVRVFDAVGKPVVLLETVGVGQVEIEVVQTADTVVVVVNPGWGDAIQAAKAGLLEIADVFALNKSDREGADQAAGDLEAMLDMTPRLEWRPPVVRTVASNGTGVDDLWQAIRGHKEFLAQDDRLVRRRRRHLEGEVRAIVAEQLGTVARQYCDGPEFQKLVNEIELHEIDPHRGAQRILELAGLSPNV